MTITWDQLATEMEKYASSVANSETIKTAASALTSDKISMVQGLVSELQGSYPDIANFVSNHITRTPGIFGTFGLSSSLSGITSQLTTLGNNRTVAKYLAEVYRAKANGADMSTISTPPAIPGGTSPTNANDADASIVLPNRTGFPAVRTTNQYAVGSLICVKGRLCVYVGGSDQDNPPSNNKVTNGWAEVDYIPVS